MLRQVNIDGVLYKIGDSRFEGDNLAYIQLPESITVGTPLTDLAPIQKALDSTDGSLLYAPSLNVFFAPTASSTPATTRIWASTTGDKGYQLKATLNESGILSSAVVVETPAGEGAYIIEYDDLDCIFVTDPTTLVTTPEAIALAQGIVDHRDCPIYIHVKVIPTIDDYLLLSHYSLNGVNENLCYHFVADKCMFLENARIEINVGIDAASGSVNGGSYYSNAFSFDNYIDLLEASEALAADKKYVDTELAIKIAKILKNSVNPSIRGDIIWKYNTNTFINTKHEWDEDEECEVDTFEMPTKVDDNVLGGTLIYPITVYSKTEGKVTTYLGAVVKPPTTDHVVVSKEYMEVPTGHASHLCLEASISGTTLNITHKNESHISSVIHVPKSVLFTSPSAFELKFAPKTTNGYTPYTPDAKIEISKDGLNWTQPTWDETDGISLVADTLNPELGKYSVFIRSDNHINHVDTSASPAIKNACLFSTVSGSNIEVSGILNALWGGKDFSSNRECYDLFYNNTALISAKNLIFPETVGVSCYSCMFQGCTAITEPPVLPATIMQSSCYDSMFYECTSLVNPPILPATTLASDCYAYMFYGCESLTKTPALPATTLGTYCYSNMFQDCTSLTKASALIADVAPNGCYSEMFSGCTSLTAAPKLSAITIGEWACNCMFQYCSSLISVPETLPATTVGQYGCFYMFQKCTKLTQAPKLPATTLGDFCYDRMFSGCTLLKEAPYLPAVVLPQHCYDGMFDQCTSLTKPGTLPVLTTLNNSCMQTMYGNCTGLNWAASGTPYEIKTADGATTPPNNATRQMFIDNSGISIEGTGTPKLNTTYYLAV